MKRYNGRRIYKDDNKIECIVQVSFYWDLVEGIEGYPYDNNFQNDEPKFWVVLSNGQTMILLGSYEEFEILLTKFDNEKKVIICN